MNVELLAGWLARDYPEYGKGMPHESRLRIWSNRVVLVAIVLAAALTMHYFDRVADRGVFLALDDSLVNISVSLSKLGRYGLLTMPLQGSEDVRTHGFY